MTPAAAASYIRLKTHTDSTSFTDANMLILLNARITYIGNKLQEAGEEYLLTSSTSNLVAGTTVATRTYALPTACVKLRGVEITLDGTNWYKCKEVEMSANGLPYDNTTIKNTFSDSDPKYIISGTNIILLTGSDISAVTNGLKFWYETRATALANVTESSTDMASSTGIPIDLHEILARFVIVDYKASRDIPLALTPDESGIYQDLEAHVAFMRNRNIDRSFVPSRTDNTDNGFDL